MTMSKIRFKVPKNVRDYLKRLLKHTSIAAVFVAVVGYWFTYQDRIDASQEQAWSVLRAALDWTQNNKDGNVGQNQSIETLSRDCDHWWRTTPLKYLLDLFFRNCVDLKSLSLMRLDFGGLRAPGAKLSHGYFACANFRGANLANSHLDYTSFMATDLGYVDFSGADLRHSCLFYADVSGAIFDQNTIIDDPSNLLKACIKPDEKGVLNGIKSTNPGISKIASQIPKCPDVENRCGELGKVNGWTCGN
jgi:hypothetical protein